MLVVAGSAIARAVRSCRRFQDLIVRSIREHRLGCPGGRAQAAQRGDPTRAADLMRSSPEVGREAAEPELTAAENPCTFLIS